MPRFRYRATDSEGNDASGVKEAHSEIGLAQELRSQGCQVSDISPVEGRRPALRKLGTVTLSDLLLFNEQLRSMLSRDLPLPKALRLLAKEAWSRRFGQAVERVAEGVEQGETLSAALARQTDVFSPMYVGVIEAGEASQNLPGVLGALTRYAKAVCGFRRKLVAAAIYPIVALVISLFIVLGFLVFIVPRFEQMHQELAQSIHLPLLTRIFVGTAGLLLNHTTECVAGIVAAAVGVWALRRLITSSPAWCDAWDRLKLRLPGGRLLQRLLMMRFCHTVSVLLKANLPLDRALALAGVCCGNRALARDLASLETRVSEGDSLATGFEREVRVFPHSMRFMLATAERRGDLPDELDRLGEIYEEEADALATRLIEAWKPFLIIALGWFIGTIILALFQPLIKLMGSLGQ